MRDRDRDRETSASDSLSLHSIGIALDVGGHSVKSALVASPGRIVGQRHATPLDSSADAATIFDSLAGIVRECMAEVGEGQTVGGVALGFPGPFDYEAGVSQIRGVAKYESIYGLNVRQALLERLDAHNLPILFRNDAEAAIVGEARYGAGRPYHRLIGITLGTGCGSSFIVDGVPVNSGEGVPPNGWLYPFLFKGQRADDLFSTRGLTARLRAAARTTGDIREAAESARQGNELARELFEAFGADLGAFLRPFAQAFEADAVLLLGGIARAYDLFGASLAERLPVPALSGELGADAALLGAAELLTIIAHHP